MTENKTSDKQGTPRTDDRVRVIGVTPSDGEARFRWLADFARQLEREVCALDLGNQQQRLQIDRLERDLAKALANHSADLSARVEKMEICHAPDGSHGRWSSTERHCYTCGVTVKHGDELKCQYVNCQSPNEKK